MSAQAARQRYLADRVSTATPAQLIVMLYDRLALDIERAAAAQESADPAGASAALLHAQQIVAELRATLDTTAWSGGEDLAGLYQYLLLRLIDAKGAASPATLRGLGVIVADLRSAWQGAAEQLSALAEPPVAAVAAPAGSGAWVG